MENVNIPTFYNFIDWFIEKFYYPSELNESNDMYIAMDIDMCEQSYMKINIPYFGLFTYNVYKVDTPDDFSVSLHSIIDNVIFSIEKSQNAQFVISGKDFSDYKKFKDLESVYFSNMLSNSNNKILYSDLEFLYDFAMNQGNAVSIHLGYMNALYKSFQNVIKIKD